ncbi:MULTISPECIES: M24 family metallopeptidase [Streptomyces]|uniref:Aminopeptidase n=1 Tax=Streptomyces xanthochromogenes TaxID=67384 RepID=A0ABQ3AXD5_9ACTN|nr:MULTISPECIES: M24 family metallopeptidase [Streptomyces]GGY66860.1 aminopeptidase [Streptomyces xanthochromogenes]
MAVDHSGAAADDRRLEPGAAEARRVEGLVAAQAKAVALFAEVEARGIVAPGVGEREASDRIRDLANDMFGTTKHWHKRIIRSGPNTLVPYRDNPPDRIIGEDDIAFADFGPIFEEYEADFGRTYVFGDDPHKHRLLADLPRVFDAGRAAFAADPRITGKQLYAEVERLAGEAGWEIGIWHAGHLVGEFPHETNDGAKAESYITPDNDNPLRRTSRSGRVCHWILELHFVDRHRGFGGFYEQLLDLA